MKHGARLASRKTSLRRVGRPWSMQSTTSSKKRTAKHGRQRALSPTSAQYERSPVVSEEEFWSTAFRRVVSEENFNGTDAARDVRRNGRGGQLSQGSQPGVSHPAGGKHGPAQARGRNRRTLV